LLIYRVEHQEYGHGPYSNHGYDFWHRRDARHRHPVPADDFDSDLRSDVYWKFGFSSPEQLTAWFTPAELRLLRRHGFIGRVYDVPDTDVIVGRSQVAFPGKKRSYPHGPCCFYCNYCCNVQSLGGVCRIYQRRQNMHELTFEMIEDDVVGDAPYGEMLANATKNVSAHIHHYWVSTIPLDKRNRAAVARIVANVLIEHTRWFLAQKPRGDDREV
jgi:hypothetical protein